MYTYNIHESIDFDQYLFCRLSPTPPPSLSTPSAFLVRTRFWLQLCMYAVYDDSSQNILTATNKRRTNIKTANEKSDEGQRENHTMTRGMHTNDVVQQLKFSKKRRINVISTNV